MKNKLNAIIFILIIGFFSIGSLCAGDKEMSELENRTLKQFPVPDAGAVRKGMYDDEFEEYVSDQLVCKDTLVRIENQTERMLLKNYINGVYFEKDRLVQEMEEPGDTLEKNVEYINEFALSMNDKGHEVYWLVAPNASYVYADKLPLGGFCYNQDNVYELIGEKADATINVINPSEALLSSRDEYIYFKTDHHWTMKGAYIAYKELCSDMNIKPQALEEYNEVKVSGSFYGSLYSKAPTFSMESDEVICYENKNRNYTGDKLYDYESLQVKDKYTFFMGGNFPILNVKSDCDNDEKILIIKDSYANCMIPFLADSFSDITIVDMRYYHENVSELIERENIGRIILINNIDFICTDNCYLWLQ